MNESELIARIEVLERKVDLLLGKPKSTVLVDLPPIPTSQYRVSNQNKSSKPTEEKSVPVNLLPILAVICFFLAAIFIVKLAIDSGWLTPLNQWLLLTAFGAILTGTGRLFESIDRKYRSYLSAAGVVVLYVSAYSSSLYFDIFPPIGAQGLAALVSILCFGLFHYHETEFFAVICAIGTYLSPVILGGKEDLIFNGAFFLIWACVFSVISTYLRSRTLPLISSYLGIGFFTFMFKDVIAFDDIRLVIIVLITQFAAFAGGTYFYSIKNRDPLSKEAAMSYLPVLLFFYGSAYYFLAKLNPDLAPWISLGFAGFLYFLFTMARSEIGNLNSQNMIQSFLAVVLFHSGYLQIVPDTKKVWLLPLIVLGTYLSEKRNDMPVVSKIMRLFFSAIAILEFLRISSTLLTSPDLIHIVPAAVTVVLGMFYYSRGSKLVKDKEGLFLGLVHLLSVLTLYRIAFDYGSLAVSASWGFYSLVILLYGYMKRDAIISKSSLLVLGVTSLKALLYDAGQAPSAIRIATLIMTGIILYASGLMFKQISQWKRPEEKKS